MFGSHLSISGGMHNALLAAEKLRLGTVQVFTKNQQQWAAKPLEPEAVREFRSHAERLGFEQMVAHASYLINLAAIEDALWQKSIASFAHEMERCDQLGIAYLVIHPGAHCGSGEECGVGRVVAALTEILEKQEKGREGGVTVCLETTAGQGSCLGCTFEQLAAMRAGIPSSLRHRVAVCLDTCHILAAGYDITTAAGTEKALADFDRVIGIEQLKVFHLNDSKKAVGSRVDRHEHVGRGCVGVEAFGVICRDERFRHVPKILETPKEPAPDGRDWDEVNLELLRKLAAGEAARPVVFEEKGKGKKAGKKGAKEQGAKKQGAAKKK